MFQLILDVEEHKVIAKEHNSNNISDSLEVTIYKKKTKKSISYTVKKARFTKAIAIIVEKRKIEDTIYSFEEVDFIMSIMPRDNEYWFFPIYENKKIDKITKQLYDGINNYLTTNKTTFLLNEYYNVKYTEMIKSLTKSAIYPNRDIVKYINEDKLISALHITFYTYLRILISLTNIPNQEKKMINNPAFVLKKQVTDCINLAQDPTSQAFNLTVANDMTGYLNDYSKKFYIFGVCQEVKQNCNKCPLANLFPYNNNELRTVKSCYASNTPVKELFNPTPDLLKYITALHITLTITLEAIYKRLLLLLTHPKH